MLQAAALRGAASTSVATSASGHSEFRPEATQELRDSKQELILKVQAMKKVRGRGTRMAEGAGRMGMTPRWCAVCDEPGLRCSLLAL